MWQAVGQQGSITDRIIAQIEDMIAAETLKPGDRLPPERDMATLLGVSRPSLREAVRALEARRRLSVRHGQGVFVELPPSEQDLRSELLKSNVSVEELYAMREVLEVPAAEWAAVRRSPEHLEGLAETLRSIDEAYATEPRDYAKIGAQDAVFHLQIVGAAGNRFLRQTVNVLQDMLQAGMDTTLTIPGRLEASRRDHRRILAAIRKGDATAAAQATRQHIRAASHAAASRLADGASGA